MAEQKKQVPLRLSTKLYNAIAAWAEDDFRSVNGQIEYLLTECVRQRKKNGKYVKIKTIKKPNTVKFTDSKLKKKKQYYYKIRAYKILNGRKYYSPFTGKKGVKIRK